MQTFSPLPPLKSISASSPQKRLRKSCRNICPKLEPVAGLSCIVDRHTHSKPALWGALQDSKHFREALWAQLHTHQPDYCERETEKMLQTPVLPHSHFPCPPSAPLPPTATFPNTNQAQRGPLLKRLKRFPQLDLRQQVRDGRSPLSAGKASHCSRAGLNGDPGGQLSEGCHWFVTGDKWGRGRSHNRLQRGRLSHNARRGRENHEKTQNLEVKKSGTAPFSNEQQQKGATTWVPGRGGERMAQRATRPLTGTWAFPGTLQPLPPKGLLVLAQSDTIPSKTPQPLLCQ